MDINIEKNSITLFGKNEKLDVLVNRLAQLSGDQLYSFFSNRGIALPRKMNIMALTSVINIRLKTLHASELSKDYFQRLLYYKDFSETQMFNLFKLICNNNEYFKMYRRNFWQLVLLNYVGLNLLDGEIKYLKDLKKLSVNNFENYFQYISSCCQEQDNTFDGQDMDNLRELLVNSASHQDILDVANKYGLELTTTLKKYELIEYMKYYLSKLGELNTNLEVEIDSSTLAGLNNLCKKYRIPMSSNMTKNELVSYLFYILSQCEITTTSMNRIESLKMYEPLEFSIDFSLIRGFNRDDSKRIIHYEGEENDEFIPLTFESEDIENPQSQDETKASDTNSDILTKQNDNDNKNIENAVDVSQNDEKPVSIEQINEQPKSEDVETTDLVEQIEIIKNNEFGNEKLTKLSRSRKHFFILGITIVILVGLIIFLLWALLR